MCKWMSCGIMASPRRRSEDRQDKPIRACFGGNAKVPSLYAKRGPRHRRAHLPGGAVARCHRAGSGVRIGQRSRRRRGGGAPPYALRVVAPGGHGVTASAGLELAAGPLTPIGEPLDTLLVAGGEGAEAAAADPALVDWVRERATQARRVASVCTGAFLLAAAGRARRAARGDPLDVLRQACPALPCRARRARSDFVCDGPCLDVGRGDGRASIWRWRSWKKTWAAPWRSPSPAIWSSSSSVPADRRSSARPCPCKWRRTSSARSMTGSTPIWRAIFRFRSWPTARA